MEINFLSKTKLNDGVGLVYSADSIKINLEISGTALSIYNVYQLSDDVIGLIFIPVMAEIYDDLDLLNSGLNELYLDTDGLKLNRDLICSKEGVEEILKRRTRRLVNGEYWEIINSGVGVKPYSIINTHQKTCEPSGSRNPDLIDYYVDEESALKYLLGR